MSELAKAIAAKLHAEGLLNDNAWDCYHFSEFDRLRQLAIDEAADIIDQVMEEESVSA